MQNIHNKAFMVGLKICDNRESFPPNVCCIRYKTHQAGAPGLKILSSHSHTYMVPKIKQGFIVHKKSNTCKMNIIAIEHSKMQRNNS